MQYSKYKDAEPTETIRKIQSIVDSIGLKTTLIKVDSTIHNIYSNRVSIMNTSFSANGKGTTEEYAMASGYAELIERIQNGIIKSATRYYRTEEETGFIYSPDEKICTVEELAVQNDAFTLFFFNFFNKKTSEEKKFFLMNLPRMENLPQNLLRCLPFADLNMGTIVYIPVDLLYPIYGSNGMSAGNTPEEAIVQALAEVLERYSNKAILEGVVPPEIPREYWEKREIGSLIHEIEADGRYHISIRDCSLGKGLPVTAAVISDYKRGTFGIHFGCHPSFEVSVERCLTEAMQGKNIEIAASMNEIGDEHMCRSIDNGPNLMKLGYGAYPIGFFSDKPSYPFIPQENCTEKKNVEMIKDLLGIISREGYSVLIRDTSHLGFPSYHILVPGMSELFFNNGQRIRESRTLNHVIESMRHFPDLSAPEEDRLMLYMKYKQFSVMENTFSWFANLPLKGEIYKTERVRAFLHYKRGETFQAYEWFKRASELTAKETEKSFLSCAAEYAWLAHISKDCEKTACALRGYFETDTVEKVHNILRDPSESMKKAFVKLPCFDCESCPNKDRNCDYRSNEAAFLKIQSAIAKSKVDQNNVLMLLRGFGVL